MAVIQATVLDRIAHLEKQSVAAHDLIRDLTRRIDQLETLLGAAIPPEASSSPDLVMPMAGAPLLG